MLCLCIWHLTRVCLKFNKHGFIASISGGYPQRVLLSVFSDKQSPAGKAVKLHINHEINEMISLLVVVATPTRNTFIKVCVYLLWHPLGKDNALSVHLLVEWGRRQRNELTVSSFYGQKSLRSSDEIKCRVLMFIGWKKLISFSVLSLPCAALSKEGNLIK